MDHRDDIKKLYRAQGTGDKVYIPAKPKISLNDRNRVFRTCAYCRVSTGSDEQLFSYELQQAHYRQVARERPNWDLRHIYADEGISGTSLKNRAQFNEMIAACERRIRSHCNQKCFPFCSKFDRLCLTDPPS